ncbi:MAG: adenylate/guanylate cyclase domain-containing protein [Methanobrevibacter sp.]|uniref:hypothetical protein n=1 Tax=Methanobrevibacter sp. TaxID=66852 RepID=UPI0025ED0F09|nr:hypothetical protein [Methanobrevibacter sp.]MBE6508187.1 adenylate/guanylate cyclase domain-containing protein [Methanobrevibacter sp.]
MVNALTKAIIKLTTKLEPIAVGTKFFPTNSLETEYVELFNYTQTILFELEKAEINSDTILQNLIRDVGAENIPTDYSFYELKPAENRIEEYALVSNIIMGSDRYFYIELPHPSNLINIFVKIIENEKGQVVEKTATELVAKMLSKNDAIRVAIELIGIGLSEGVQVISAVGMTGAASIERAIHYTQNVGSFPGIAFTKLGGEYALVFDSPFLLRESRPVDLENYLFIDLIDSTKFIDKHGRNELVELMNGIKNFIESECDGELEGYREGGDDFIARFPSKDLAIRAGLDAAWFALNNGAKIRAGIGRSRREAGERAQLVDSLESTSPLSLVVFDLANGLYAYNIPSEFTRTLINLIENEKAKLIGVFAFVFIFTYLLAVLGLGMYSFVVIILVVAYAFLA